MFRVCPSQTCKATVPHGQKLPICREEVRIAPNNSVLHLNKEGMSASSLGALTPGRCQSSSPRMQSREEGPAVTGRSPLMLGSSSTFDLEKTTVGGSEGVLRALAAFPHFLICILSLKEAKSDSAAPS